MQIDFAAPAFFNQIRATKGHGASTYLVTLAALTQGLSVTFFCSQAEAGINHPLFAKEVAEPIFYRVSNPRRAHFFNATQSDRISATACATTRDKLKTKALLHAKNLNTPVGGVMSAQDHALLGRLHQAGVRRFVIKPVAGSLGKGVFLNQTAQQVAAYLRANPEQSFLVEQHINGFEHRVYVVDGVVVAANQRIPNNVVGNGSDTVATLFAARQEDRRRNPYFADKTADLAEVEMTLLTRGGAWSDVPARGQIVWLAKDGIPGMQGDFPLSLDSLPEAAKHLAVAATKAVAAQSAGLDILVEPSGTAYVLEINIRPWIGAQSFPHPQGDYNLTLPNALIQSVFGAPNPQPRPLLGFDYQALGAEVFRQGRVTKGVEAADFAQFGPA